jgi:O-antigen ligase
MIYRASLELWRMFPWLGTGLGTFEAAFPLVQPAEIGGRVWSHAHNDWLEVLVTTGVAGFALLLAAALALVAGLRTVLLGSVSSSSRALAVAALGGLVGVGLHEMLDFGLTMPANAMTLAALAGVALGSARPYGAEGDGSSSIKLIRPGENGR